MDISERVCARKVRVIDWTGQHLRDVGTAQAVDLIATGFVPMGRKRVIHVISQPLPHEIVAAIEEAKKPKARQHRRIPTQQPMTTTAESWDNPPRVIKFRPIPLRTRLIFVSTLCGRAGILVPSEQRRTRAALREM